MWTVNTRLIKHWSAQLTGISWKKLSSNKNNKNRGGNNYLLPATKLISGRLHTHRHRCTDRRALAHHYKGQFSRWTSTSQLPSWFSLSIYSEIVLIWDHQCYTAFADKRWTCFVQASWNTSVSLLWTHFSQFMHKMELLPILFLAYILQSHLPFSSIRPTSSQPFVFSQYLYSNSKTN